MNSKKKLLLFIKFQHILNLIGLKCPDPIILLRRKLRSIKKKEIIFIISDDFSIKREFKLFCSFIGHKLLYFYKKNKYYFCAIKKK